MAQTLRMPKTAAEAAQQVAELKPHGVNGLKAILESGYGSTVYNRLDTTVYKAIVAAAKAQGLPVSTHTGDLRDINDAIDAGSTTVRETELSSHISVRGAAPFSPVREGLRPGSYAPR